MSSEVQAGGTGLAGRRSVEGPGPRHQTQSREGGCASVREINHQRRDTMAANLQELLTVMVQRGASDLHLSCGTYPQIRLNGSLEPLEEFEALMPPDTQRLVYSVLTEDQQRRVEQDNELDLSFGVEGLARFRCNVYRQRGALCAAMRVVPYTGRTLPGT